MWRRLFNRLLVVAAVGGACAAGAFAVMSALDPGNSSGGVSEAQAAGSTLTSKTVSFGHNRVIARVRNGGLACFKVTKGSSTVARSCVGSLGPKQIAYATSRYAVGGLAGSEVKGVIVRLTNKGTVWAKLRHGAFYAAIPKGRRPTKVVKIVTGGARTTFTVTGTS